LAQDRARRYQSAAALAADLRAYLASQPIAARPPSAFYLVSMFARRHKALVGSLAAVFVIAVAATVISAGFAIQESRARAREQRSLYLANVVAADLAIRQFDAATARARLEDAPVELRHWEWYYLWQRHDLAQRVFAGRCSHCEAVTAGGGVIATAWHDPVGRDLVLWSDGGIELARAAELRSLPVRIAFDPEGRIVWGALDGTLWRWHPDRDEHDVLPGRHDALVTGIAVTRDGRVVSAGRDGTLRVTDGRESQQLVAAGVEWHDLALSPDDAFVVAGAADGTASLWPLGGGAPSLVVRAHEQRVLAVAVRPDGEAFATGSTDGTVRLLGCADGGELMRWAAHDGEVLDLRFADRDTLVSAGGDRTIRVLDLPSGAVTAVLHGHENAVKALAAVGDGEFVSGGYDGTARTWRLGGDRRRIALAAYPRDVAFASDGTVLAAGCADGTVRLFDAASRAPLGELRGHTERAGAVAFAPDEPRLASASIDGTVRLWDVGSRRQLAESERGADGFVTLAYEPKGRILAAGSKDGSLWLLSARDLRVERRLPHGASVEQIAFDRRGERLASVTADPPVLRVFDARDWREALRVELACRPHDVLFSPDGELVAMALGEFDGRGAGVELRDPASGAVVARLQGHSDLVLGLAFSPDGGRLATASADTTVRIWDLATGAEMLVLREHEDWVWSVVFSPDGDLLVSAGGRQGGVDLALCVFDARPR
jgi:WD40 repeat protein